MGFGWSEPQLELPTPYAHDYLFMPNRIAVKIDRKLRRRLLSACLGMGIAFVGAEIILRIYNPIRSPARANDIVLPVFKTFESRLIGNPKMSEDVRICYNSMGLRGPERPADYADLTTILTVGGSTTECVGLTDGSTWPDRLRTILDKELASCWLNNAGFNGHSSFGHLILLNKHLVQLKPDYIIFLVGCNDVERGDLNDWDVGLQAEHDGLVNQFINNSEVLSTIQTLYRATRAFDLGVHHEPGMDFTKLRNFDGVSKDVEAITRDHQHFLESYRARLHRCVAICEAHSIKAILVNQPALYGDCVDPTTGVDLGKADYGNGRSGAHQWQILEIYNEVTRQVAQDRDVPLIDLARSLPKDSKYYFDWIHFSLEGANEVARRIGAELVPILAR
ncbi:MAG: lysophospholipase L1-like esterase [Hyphomicrobiaceae bacterium]